MTENPMISFCVLFYNQEKYVEETLDSMLYQDYINYEIVIRDDCSSDQTKEVIRQYLSENNININIKVDYGNENLGITKSLNRVLSMSKGEYIALQGGDDVSLPSRLSDCMKLILKYNIDLIGADATVINENREVIFNSFYIRTENGADNYNDNLKKMNLCKIDTDIYSYCSNSKLISSCCLGGFGILFNRRILNYFNGFFPELIEYEDRLLTFLANMNLGCILYNKPLVLYRRTNNNVSVPISTNYNDILNIMIKLKIMENSVCECQLEYLHNSGFVNEKYNKNEMVDCLYLEYFRNLFKIKSVNRNSSKENKFHILMKIIMNSNIKSKSKLKYIIAFLVPFLYKRMIVKEYTSRKQFFGN